MIFVNYVFSPNLRAAEDILDAYYELTGWVEGLTSAGDQVTVFQRFHKDDTLEIEGASYRFYSDNLSPGIHSYHIPLRLHREISKFTQLLTRGEDEHVLHVNGLLFPLQVLHLRLSVPRKCCIVLQHHAEPPRRGVGNIIQRMCLRPVDGFMFSTKEHAKEWTKAGIIRPGHIIGEIMETSSRLRYEDRHQARQQTGLTGNPILLWTGNLNQNKDPITILKGMKSILRIKPDARLYMAYRYDDLLSEVIEFINSSKMLKNAVTLLGPIPYSEIGAYYNSADFFVQGSHRESSGIALSDALACGVIPVVTDIPSFRVITESGKFGALWPPGNHQAFAEALLSLLRDPITQLSLAARKHFKDNLSFERLGKQASDFYKKVVSQRSRNFIR